MIAVHYTRTNTLIFFLIVAVIACACLLTHSLWRTWREKRFQKMHPLVFTNLRRGQRYEYILTAEALYHAMQGETVEIDFLNEEQAERVFQNAHQWFENNYDLHKDEQ